MDRTERAIVAIALFTAVVAFWIIWFRGNSLEARLQKVEQLFNVRGVESRPSVPIGPTNGLPAFAPTPRKRSDAKVK